MNKENKITEQAKLAKVEAEIEKIESEIEKKQARLKVLVTQRDEYISIINQKKIAPLLDVINNSNLTIDDAIAIISGQKVDNAIPKEDMAQATAEYKVRGSLDEILGD